MSRVYNFSAGPAVLPEEVLKEVADEMMDYNGTGMSVMEMSHRSAAFQEIIDTAEKDLRELMNIPDMIRGIETQKIGALALDVFDKEDGIYHENRRDDILSNRDMAYLRQFPNVIMTQHMAFYTDAAVQSMVFCGIEGLCDFARTGHTETELV